jgi:hypothetical protein
MSSIALIAVKTSHYGLIWLKNNPRPKRGDYFGVVVGQGPKS